DAVAMLSFMECLLRLLRATRSRQARVQRSFATNRDGSPALWLTQLDDPALCMRSLERVNQRVANDGVVEVGRGRRTRSHRRGVTGVGLGHVDRRALGHVRRSETIARWRDDLLHLAL